MLPPGAKAACKERFCRSPLGNLVNNMLKPVGAFSGGMVGSCCPPALPSDLAKPPDSAEGAAARIKADEAEAKARRAAVRYLGTVDCHYWPEAQAALIIALRADRNECVRLEAALALVGQRAQQRRSDETHPEGSDEKGTTYLAHEASLVWRWPARSEMFR